MVPDDETNEDKYQNNESFMKYMDNMMAGSMGKEGDMETAGGGRIWMRVDSIQLDSGKKIHANARPFESYSRFSYPLPGGSGGYIFI